MCSFQETAAKTKKKAKPKSKPTASKGKSKAKAKAKIKSKQTIPTSKTTTAPPITKPTANTAPQAKPKAPTPSTEQPAAAVKQTCDAKLLKKRTTSSAYHTAYAKVLKECGDVDKAKQAGRLEYQKACQKFELECKTLG